MFKFFQYNERGCKGQSIKTIDLLFATIGTQEWRGHSYALNLRGEPRKNGTPTI